MTTEVMLSWVGCIHVTLVAWLGQEPCETQLPNFAYTVFDCFFPPDEENESKHSIAFETTKLKRKIDVIKRVILGVCWYLAHLIN